MDLDGFGWVWIDLDRFGCVWGFTWVWIDLYLALYNNYQIISVEGFFWWKFVHLFNFNKKQ